jgi:type I restriction-modification system DNA methylase subunit
MQNKTLISPATIDNWNRLASNTDNRLKGGANKRQSQKNIIPKEYIKERHNLKKIIEITKSKKTHDIIYSSAFKLLKNNNIKNSYSEKILKEFGGNYIDITLPTNENDILGIIYQTLLKEGDKNKKGSYYTPQNFIEIEYEKSDKILDPCCGTGSFLLSYKIDPSNLYGIDIDPTACFIAKINLIVKYKNFDFEPNIFCADFLTITDLPKFDIIATNPPWGAMITAKYDIPQVKSGESFSYFIAKSKEFLKKKW